MIETPIQMRFADVDQLGHVNNVNLQHYFDLGKTDYYVQVFPTAIDWHKQAFIQKATNTVYEAQTRMGEPIVVRTKVEKIGTTSFSMYQEIVNLETSELKSYSRSTLVMFDFERQEKIPVPDAWREVISRYENTEF